MADIKPMLNELKSKIPSKETVMAFIDGMDLQIDTKKIKETTTKLQTQIVDLAETASKNPKVQEVVTTLLSSKATNQAILKLKEVLPNQDLINKIDMARLSFLKGNKAEEAEVSEAASEEVKPTEDA
ncbi:MAG: hypothetical protein KDD37_03985 [Bdellovibrionales bacterium]|nr:hypothetical protein [Bdellovibrionales bacterium]